MEKIEALKKTIYNLENGVYYYNWGFWDSCNCGILARTILNGKKPSECGSHKYDHAFAMPDGFSGQINDTINYCRSTGSPLPEVFKALNNTGFTHEELRKLEKCGEVKSRVINYLKKWVSTFEKESPHLVNSERNPEECDASKADSSNAVWPNKQSEIANLIPIVDEVVDVKNVKIEL